MTRGAAGPLTCTPAFLAAAAGLWLGPDTGLEIKVPAGYMDPRSDRAEYTVHIITSDIK